MTSTLTRPAPTSTPPVSTRPYTVLLGLGTLAILLQGLWAGIFLEHDGKRDAAGNWIEVHAHGGEVAIAFIAAATVLAFVRMRPRRDLWQGGAALVALLLLESYLGGLIADDGKDVLTAVHVPIAMAAMGLAVWLTVRSRRSTDVALPDPYGDRQVNAGRRSAAPSTRHAEAPPSA